jgi:hypothetical protein
MPQAQAKSPWYVSTIFIVIVAALIMGGIRLIVLSESQYAKSIEYTERVLADTIKNKPSMAPNYTLTKDGYSGALLYFSLAIGVVLLAVLLPRIQNISIGTSGVNLNLKDIPEKLDDIIKQNNAIQATSAGIGGYKKISIEAAPELIKRNFSNIAPAEYIDDPQKGKWGGKAIDNGRQLSAEVIPISDSNFFKVTILVKSIKPGPPLKGLVKFHLHNTFLNPDPVIAVENNEAVLVLNKVYGAFTVGAEADDGNTTLELDLSLDERFPLKFRNR